jgi:hypothetical protein
MFQEGTFGSEFQLDLRNLQWSPTGKALGSQEMPTRSEHPVPEDQFTQW